MSDETKAPRSSKGTIFFLFYISLILTGILIALAIQVADSKSSLAALKDLEDRLIGWNNNGLPVRNGGSIDSHFKVAINWAAPGAKGVYNAPFYVNVDKR